MKKEEAIFYIKELQKTYASMDKKVAEAVDMAIQALKDDELILYKGIATCKDCKYWTGIVLGSQCKFLSGMDNKFHTREDDWCCWGERKRND